MTQEDAWWGLDRIDQRVLPLDGEYAYETCDEAAPATDVYIFDTGVRCSHMEFDALAPGGARRCVGAWDIRQSPMYEYISGLKSSQISVNFRTNYKIFPA